ncbi:alpha/beta fold hydrolase [Actinoplanes sp. CA-252034]|uniref:alpha/beta fold hydrolase n=1 Tax=Actinoplanes sp. CA-252034 TaxID=3239906 RepID=UPI003D95392D
MRRVEVVRPDAVVSCLDGGHGDDVVVLLHGLAGSAEEMRPTATALLPGRRVIAVDQRGHGHSTRRPGDLSRRAYADDVRAVVDQLADGRPVTLVGQSMGGHTAMLTAAWHPRIVRRLVLLEAGVGGGDSDHPAKIGDWFASWPVPFADAPAAAGFLGSSPIARAWIDDLEECADGLRPRFDPDVMRAAIAAVTDTARWAEWQRVEAPTLLVRGANGTVPEPEAQRMLASRPGVAQAVIPDAGHDAHLEQHDAWIRILTTFIAG